MNEVSKTIDGKNFKNCKKFQEAMEIITKSLRNEAECFYSKIRSKKVLNKKKLKK